MGVYATRREIDYPIAPTPQGFQESGGNLGDLLSAMFVLGKPKNMSSMVKPLDDLSLEKIKKTRRR